MDFIVDYEKLNQMEKLKESIFCNCGDIFIESDRLLIKILNSEKLAIIQYLRSLPKHDNVIKPITVGSVTYSIPTNKKEYTLAYRMTYLKNAKTFSQNHSSLSYEEKMNYINQVFDALKFLHQYIVVGDINPNNILISGNNAYITDLDESKKLNEWFKHMSCYYNLNFLDCYGNTKYTDIIKMYIECLGFLLDIQFSRYIYFNGYKNFYKLLTFQSQIFPPEILNLLKISLHPTKLKKMDIDVYNPKNFINADALELKRTLNLDDYTYKKN